MKAIKIYLFPLILITGSLALKAQDDFYSTSQTNDSSQIIIENGANEVEGTKYYTEIDYYNEVESSQKNDTEVEIYSEQEGGYNNDDEIYADSDEEEHRKRRNGVGAEIAAEILVEVVYHALFFVAWWCQ